MVPESKAGAVDLPKSGFLKDKVDQIRILKDKMQGVDMLGAKS